MRAARHGRPAFASAARPGLDDHADALEAIALLLELDGHDVKAVDSATQALQVAPGWLPDVALLDIGLRGMKGYELARRLRGEPSLSRLRLVAVTGYGHPGDRAQVLAAGFEAHLTKPVEPEVLGRVLAEQASARSV